MDAVDQQDEFLTLREVARMVGSNYRTVWAWVHSGKLPALDTAPPGARQARIRVRRSDVEALMREYRPENHGDARQGGSA